MDQAAKDQIKSKIEEELIIHDWTFEWCDDLKGWRAGNNHRHQIIQMSVDAELHRDEFFKIIRPYCADETIFQQWVKSYDYQISKR